MLRILIILLAVALVMPEKWLPANPYSQAQAEGGEDVGVGDLMALARRVGSDVSGLCMREPLVCSTTAQLGGQVRDRALAWTSAFGTWLEGLGEDMEAIQDAGFDDAGGRYSGRYEENVHWDEASQRWRPQSDRQRRGI